MEAQKTVKGFEKGIQRVSNRAESQVFYDTKKYASFLSTSLVSLSTEPLCNMLINTGSDPLCVSQCKEL